MKLYHTLFERTAWFVLMVKKTAGRNTSAEKGDEVELSFLPVFHPLEYFFKIRPLTVHQEANAVYLCCDPDH